MEAKEQQGCVVVMSKKMVLSCRHGNAFNIQTNKPSARPILFPEVSKLVGQRTKAAFASQEQRQRHFDQAHNYICRLCGGSGALVCLSTGTSV